MGDSNLRTALLIPTRNEADALGRVLSGLPRGRLHEVLVIDHASTDGTPGIAAQAGARVIAEPRRGYGRACLAGLAALDPAVDTVVFMDGDHSDDPADLPRILAPIEAGEADLVIGSRTAQAEPGSLTLQQRVGNRLACALMRRLFGARYTDLGPFRAVRRDALERLRMRDVGFGWTVEMQAKAARQGLRVVEVPVRYRRRIGRSKISGTVGGTLRAGWAIPATIGRVACRPPASAGRDGDRLLLFIKEPVPGRVKTRLAEAVGPDAACGVYRACVELTLERLSAWRLHATLWGSPAEAAPALRQWVGGRWTLYAERGDDLGERLAAAFQDAFQHGARRAAAIGTDSPWLHPEDIGAACDALAAADVVIGPTEDGGYYLIGLSRHVPELFAGITWGSPRVCAQTQDRARALGLRVRLLRMGYDLDHHDDVVRFIQEERRRGLIPEAVRVMDTCSRPRAHRARHSAAALTAAASEEGPRCPS